MVGGELDLLLDRNAVLARYSRDSRRQTVAPQGMTRLEHRCVNFAVTHNSAFI
jgi:hypothetical protein